MIILLALENLFLLVNKIVSMINSSHSTFSTTQSLSRIRHNFSFFSNPVKIFGYYFSGGFQLEHPSNASFCVDEETQNVHLLHDFSCANEEAKAFQLRSIVVTLLNRNVSYKRKQRKFTLGSIIL